MRTEKWYTRRLARYFEDHYGEYEEYTEWYVDPADNVWKYYIPVLGSIVTIACDIQSGSITEEKESVEKKAENLYLVLKDKTEAFDAVYADYIIELVGEDGLYLLVREGFIEPCGTVNGRKLYAVR